MACLQLTTPTLRNLEYPADAEAHFLEVNASVDKWVKGHKYHCAAGYCGPWVENHWINYFGKLWANRKPGTQLHDIFGPYIPILVPWVDTWVNSGYHFPDGMIDAWKAKLRPNVAYITVAQNDEGLLARASLKMKDIPNVLVLSGGGYGHVPVPLLKASENLVETSAADRTYIVSFMGTLGHAPHNLREDMAKTINSWARDLHITDKVKVASGEGWRGVMADSRFSMTPRGFGRTSYHLAETLQMGLVPIHVYTDIPWVPYADLWKQDIGRVTNIAGLRPLLQTLKDMSPDEVSRMEKRVRELRDSHFMPSGAMLQIFKFMTGSDGSGDLRCEKLPHNERD